MTNSLLNRLEAADGPDRELDAEIAMAFKGCRPPMKTIGRYTASLDAALALAGEVLPGWAVKIDGPKWTYLDHSKWTAMLKEPRGEPEFHQGSMVPLYPHRTIIGETHKSPAIAMILALLRATSQEAGDAPTTPEGKGGE